jgi:SAM-dependent methyltransferase
LSKTAINLVKNHQLYQEEHVNAIKADLVNDPIPFEENTADYCLFLFVLSAITPEKFPQVLAKLSAQIKKGGVVYFRDYGRYDMAQLRFAQRGKQKLADNFYVCADKTRRYYFTIE